GVPDAPLQVGQGRELPVLVAQDDGVPAPRAGEQLVALALQEPAPVAPVLPPAAEVDDPGLAVLFPDLRDVARLLAEPAQRDHRARGRRLQRLRDDGGLARHTARLAAGLGA